MSKCGYFKCILMQHSSTSHHSLHAPLPRPVCAVVVSEGGCDKCPTVPATSTLIFSHGHRVRATMAAISTSCRVRLQGSTRIPPDWMSWTSCPHLQSHACPSPVPLPCQSCPLSGLGSESSVHAVEELRDHSRAVEEGRWHPMQHTPDRVARCYKMLRVRTKSHFRWKAFDGPSLELLSLYSRSLPGKVPAALGSVVAGPSWKFAKSCPSNGQAPMLP